MCGQTTATNATTQALNAETPKIQSFPFTGVPLEARLRTLGTKKNTPNGPATIHVASDHGIYLSAPALPGRPAAKAGAQPPDEPALYLLGNAPAGAVGLSLTNLNVEDEGVEGSTFSVDLAAIDGQIHALLGSAPFTLEYNITPDAVTLQSTALPPNLPANMLGAPSVLCLVKCAGVQLMPAIISCLPSLVGGPAAFMSCLVSTAGPTVAGLASCIGSCF